MECDMTVCEILCRFSPFVKYFSCNQMKHTKETNKPFKLSTPSFFHLFYKKLV